MFRAFGLGLENESIHVPYAANRFNRTWSLLPIGQKGPLFHSRMIRRPRRGQQSSLVFDLR